MQMGFKTLPSFDIVEKSVYMGKTVIRMNFKMNYSSIMHEKEEYFTSTRSCRCLFAPCKDILFLFL